VLNFSWFFSSATKVLYIFHVFAPSIREASVLLTLGYTMKVDISKAKTLIEKYRGKKGSLIPLLQEVQGLYGFVPAEIIELIAHELEVFPARIYGVVTFYTQFRLDPPGKHTIRVCQGTACHVMGGKDILDFLTRELGISDGQTTKDGLFSLERVACLGCCGMAPVVQVDEEFFGNVTVQRMDEIVKEYRSREGGGQ